MGQIRIGNRPIGAGHDPYIVAEIGFNHGGDIDLALRMIADAARSGADAVKFQTFRAARLTLESSPHFDLVRGAELSRNDHRRLADAAALHGVQFLSTPFCEETAELLNEVGVPAYKVASMDADNLPLLRTIAQFGKPILLSTGMATLSEIGAAVAAIRKAGNDQIILLHCNSLYPTPIEHANLRTMAQLQDAFGLPVGYSDHVLGNAVALAAATLGATVIEKHFTSDRALPGPDHAMSSDPAELADLVRAIRTMGVALGRAAADDTRPDRGCATDFRRSLHAAVTIPKGTVVDATMLKAVRPGGGLPPDMADQVIGRVARLDIPREARIALDNVDA